MKEIVIKVKDDIYEKARNEYYGENEVSASMVNEIFSAVFHGIPSVNPQEKTGHWIFHEIEDTLRWYECDQCGAEAVKEYDYCHGCGARMVEPQEGE